MTGNPEVKGRARAGLSMGRATVRFYGELNDFLDPPQRGRDILIVFQGAPAIRNPIESMGVPHVEVALILANGRAVDLSYRVADHDRISVYPAFRRLDLPKADGGEEEDGAEVRFAVDIHLRKLARLLRLLGVDAAWCDATAEKERLRCLTAKGRTLLTRNRQLLMRRDIERGYWIRSSDPREQAREVMRRFDLLRRRSPAARCIACNGTLRPVAKDDVIERIPPKTAMWLDAYRECTNCGKLYWEGTHWQRLRAEVRSILGVAGDSDAARLA